MRSKLQFFSSLIFLSLTLLVQANFCWADKGFLEHKVGARISYCEDSSRFSSIEEAQRCHYIKQMPALAPSLSKTSKWIKIEVPNEVGTKAYAIKIEPFLLHKIDIFYQSESEWKDISTGSNQKVNPEVAVFGGYRILVPASSTNSSEYFIAISSPSLSMMSVQVVTSTNKTAVTDEVFNLGLGVQLGLLLAILIFAIFNYLFNRTVVMGRFILLSLDVLICLLCGSGIVMQTLLPNYPALNEIIFHTALCARVALWVWVTQALLAAYRTPTWYDKVCYLIYTFVVLEILLNPIFNFLWLSTVVGLIVFFVPLIHLYVVKRTDDIPKEFRQILNVGFTLTLIFFVCMVGSVVFAIEPKSEYSLYIARLTDLATPLILLGVIAYRNRLIHDELGEIKHALNEAKIRAEYESKLLSDRQTLIDMLAHELKNPLTSIGLAIDNLSSYSSPGENSQKRIANINRSIRDMDEIIERCNLMNNLESKEIALEKNTILLDEFIHEIISNLDADERISGYHLEDISLSTDAKFLKVIFTNLIQNALKYSKPNSTIKIEATEKTGYISIFFINKISTTMLPDESSIFERFYRHPLAQKHRGAGLGLYLTREICKLLGGHISYSHQNGVVSFAIELPN